LAGQQALSFNNDWEREVATFHSAPWPYHPTESKDYTDGSGLALFHGSFAIGEKTRLVSRTIRDAGSSTPPWRSVT
jgi:hypothetical protein